jgi:hypothetical protein
VDLSLWNPETSRLLVAIAMNGGSAENSLGGSITIESGVGTEATDSDSGAASFRPPMQVFLESVVACH